LKKQCVNFWKKATEECSSGATSLGAHKHTLQSFKNTILSRNVDQNMLKNALFFGKMLEKSPQRWGLCHQTLLGLRRLGALPPDPQVVTPTQFTCYFKQLCEFFGVVTITTYT